MNTLNFLLESNGFAAIQVAKNGYSNFLKIDYGVNCPNPDMLTMNQNILDYTYKLSC